MDLSTLSNAMADAVEQAAAGVVTVNGRRRLSATGIVWQPELVLTADHVVERDEELSIIAPDGTEHRAELVGRAPASDLALLRVPGAALTPATFATTEPRVGQIVLAIGRPGAGTAQASWGLINAIGSPRRSRRSKPDTLIRTDATPYPGFSGGPLVDVGGSVVGLFTSWRSASEPVAIPIAHVVHVAEQLARHGHVRRGYLGISSQPIALPERQRAGRQQEIGLLIVRVEDGSPASAAGLLVGDILVGVEGHEITDPARLQDVLGGERIGTEVAFEVVRGDALHTLSVTIGERP